MTLHGNVMAAFFLLYIRFLLFVDVVTERLKVRREAQEAKRRAAKQEAETGSVKTMEDTAEITSQLDNGEHAEAKEDARSQGKSELNIQYSVNQHCSL